MRAFGIPWLTVLLSAACSDGGSLMKARAPERAVAGAAPAPSAALTARSSYSPAVSFEFTQKLIRTAELQIQVKDVPSALKVVDTLARSRQAVLADSRTSQDADGKRTASVVLRVPSQQFASLLQALRGLGDLKDESIGTQDVTKQYADLETRLAVKEQTVARLRSLLENRTAKLSDVLEVERELGRAVAELEQMKGERRFYDQQIALSTVQLTLFERVPSRANQITRPIAEALQSSMQVLGTSIGALIYLVIALLPWVLVAVGIIWVVKPLRRRLFRPRAVPEQ